MPEPDKTDLAYAAGIIDGEGSICILRVRAGTGKRSLSPAWFGRVIVDMTDSPIPAWFKQTFGGSLYIPKKSRRQVWYIARHDAVAFLDQVRPYLRQKGAQADLLKDFYSDPEISFKPRKWTPHNSLPPEQIAARDSYAERLSALNGRKRVFSHP